VSNFDVFVSSAFSNIKYSIEQRLDYLPVEYGRSLIEKLIDWLNELKGNYDTKDTNLP